MESIQHTPNRMAFTAKLEENNLINAQTDENENILITTFKSSPRTPAVLEKKKPLKKKGAKKGPRQRNRFGSQSSERSDSSQLRAQQPVGTSYNLIEYYGDQGSRALASGSTDLDPLPAYPMGSREFGSQKVVFVIPEGWASAVEVMRFPLPPELNPLDNSSSSVTSADEGPGRFGPIRSKTFRNTPCNPRQSYDFETMPTVVRGENLNGSYYPSGGSDSIGPIRRSSMRRMSYMPYGHSSRKRSSLNSVDSGCTSASGESYNQPDNNFRYSGAKIFKSYKYILCWHCHRRGHIKVNCPLRQMTHRK